MSGAAIEAREMAVQPPSLQPADWREATGRFAEILNLDTDPPEAVLRRAMVDSTFAHRLLISRKAPRMLAALIADPANARFASPPVPAGEPLPATATPDGQPDSGPSSLALLGRAGSALARWAATGFTHADEAVIARRLASCDACPNARAAADKLAYRIGGARRATICGLCGCPLERKARMSTETCPGEDPDRPGWSRWGEAIAS